MAIDYEIIKLESSYSEVVSGCNEETWFLWELRDQLYRMFIIRGFVIL
jgi:hypothetical protein